MIVLRLTIIFWVKRICFASLKASMRKTQKIIQILIKYLERLSEFSSLCSLCPMSLPRFSIFLFTPLFLLCLQYLLFASYRGVNHRWDDSFVVLLLLFCAVSGFPSLLFFLVQLSFHSCFLFWSSHEFCLFAVFMPGCLLLSRDLSFLFFYHSPCFCQYSSASLCLIFLSSLLRTLIFFFFFSEKLSGSVVCFLAHLLVVYLLVFFLPIIFSLCFVVSVLFLAVCFSVLRWKDHSCLPFVVFALRVFPLVLCHMLLVWRLGSNKLTCRALLMCSRGIC